MKIAVAAESDAGEPQVAGTPETPETLKSGPWSHIWGPKATARN
jgi:hypothetical protein